MSKVVRVELSRGVLSVSIELFECNLTEAF